MKKLLTGLLAFALSFGAITPAYAATTSTPEERAQAIEALVDEYYDEVFNSTVNPYVELQAKIEACIALQKETQWELEQLQAANEADPSDVLAAGIEAKEAALKDIQAEYDEYVAQVEEAKATVEVEKNQTEAALESKLSTSGKTILKDVGKVAIAGAVTEAAKAAVAVENQMIASYESQLAENQAKVDEYQALIDEQNNNIAASEAAIAAYEAQILPAVVAANYDGAVLDENNQFTVNGINYTAALENGQVIITQQDTTFNGSVDDVKAEMKNGVTFKAKENLLSVIEYDLVLDGDTVKVATYTNGNCTLKKGSNFYYTYTINQTIKIGWWKKVISVDYDVDLVLTEMAHVVNTIDITTDEAAQELLAAIDVENAKIEEYNNTIAGIQEEQAPYVEKVNEINETLHGESYAADAVIDIASGDYTNATVKALKAYLKGEISADDITTLIAIAKAISAGNVTEEQLNTLINILSEINFSEDDKLEILEIVQEKAYAAHENGLATLDTDVQNIRSDLKKAVKAYIYSEIKLEAIQEIDYIMNQVNQ